METVMKNTANDWYHMLTFIVYVHLFVFPFGSLVGGRRIIDGEITPAFSTYKNSNPIAVLWKAMKALSWAICKTPDAWNFAKRLIVSVFKEIHSDIRLLCACDAALGAAIGYFTGNVILGAIAGGIFGVLNYEIVTKRLLKIKSDSATQ